MGNQIEKDVEKRLKKKYNRFKTFLLLILLPIIVLSGTYGIVAGWNATMTNGKIKRVLDSGLHWYGDHINVDLIPTGHIKDALNESPPPTIAEIIFCLDTSGSMGGMRPGDPLYESVTATKVLIKILNASGAKIGLSVFADQFKEVVKPTLNTSELEKGISSLPSAGGGTDIPLAVQRSAEMFSDTLGLIKIVVVVTDGYGDINNTKRNINRYYKENGIVFIGIGVGESSSKEFFAQTFYDDPHRSSCCNNDHKYMIRLFTEMAVDNKILKTLGYDMKLVERPHFSAFPGFEANAEGKAPALIDPLVDVEKGELLFPLLYMLDVPVKFSYQLKAKATGVHPVAVAPAQLTYIDNKTASLITEKSGRSPLVFVISPMLLFWMFLPSLLYALLIFLIKPKLSLFSPDKLSQPGRDLLPPPVSFCKFKRNSLDPISPAAEDELVPTVLIGIGSRGGEIVAGTLANRRETGFKPISDRFFPIYIDCRILEDKDYPGFHNTKIDSSMAKRLPSDNFLTSLIQDVSDNPSKHASILSWIDAQRHTGGIDISTGCDGDREIARLSLYQDLLSDSPVLHQIRDEVVKWSLKHDFCQIFIAVGAEEDIGSGWLIDMGFHLRKRLKGRSVPVYAVIDHSRGEKFCRPENASALWAELKVCQGGSGWPYYNMDNINGVVNNESSVLLPLFDRVINLRHAKEPPNPGASGAAIMELTDKQVASHLREKLSGTAIINRAVASHDENQYVTEIDASSIILPIELWKERWLTWIVRDILKEWTGYELIDNKIILSGIDDESAAQKLDIINEADASPPLTTLGFWKQISNKIKPEENIESDKGILKRELIIISASYLNGASVIHQPDDPEKLVNDRIGRFSKLEKLFNDLSNYLSGLYKDEESKKNKIYQDAMRALSFAQDCLQEWKNSLILSEDKKQPALFQQIAKRLSELDLPDPSMAPGGGRFLVGDNRLELSEMDYYNKKIVPNVLENCALPVRLWWAPKADGTSLEIILLGINTVHLTPDDILSGILVDELKRLLTEHLFPEINRLSIDELIKVEDIKSLFENMGIRNEGAVFALHSFHEKVKERSAVQAFSDTLSSPIPGAHIFSDRISFISIIENQWACRKTEKMERWRNLPLTQPFAKIPVDMHVNTQGMFLGGRDDIKPTIKLLSQSQELLYCALCVVAGGSLRLGGASPSVSQYFFDPGGSKGDTVPVTLVGDISIETALLQTMLRRRDVSGNFLDPLAAMEHWDRMPDIEQIRLLNSFWNKRDMNGHLEDWEILLLWKTKMELNRIGGSV